MAKIYFQCDYCEGAHPRILNKLIETNLVQTVGYGLDPYCKQAREIVKDVCDAPDADVHFLVGGTQTNATVIASVLKPYQGVLCAESGHINVHETGAIEHSGHKCLALPSPDGKITAAQIAAVAEDRLADSEPEHMVQPGMVYISFPTEVGTIYSLSELQEISAVCHKYDMPLFIDGARLGYGLMSSSSDVTVMDIASLADVFYIGGTKQGALFGEAVIITDDRLKKDFRFNIKQNGGMLAKGRLLGIQFGELLKDGLYFELARKADLQAERIKAAFAELGCDFLIDSPTNQQFPILDSSMVEALEQDFVFSHWQNMPDGRIAVRFCTSWATKDEAVDLLIEKLQQFK